MFCNFIQHIVFLYAERPYNKQKGAGRVHRPAPFSEYATENKGQNFIKLLSYYYLCHTFDMVGLRKHIDRLYLLCAIASVFQIF